MISKIYFEYSGATEGPFELDDVIDRLSSENVLLMILLILRVLLNYGHH